MRLYHAKDGDTLASLVWLVYGVHDDLDEPQPANALDALLAANQGLLDIPAPFILPPGTPVNIPDLEPVTIRPLNTLLWGGLQTTAAETDELPLQPETGLLIDDWGLIDDHGLIDD